MKKAAIIGMLFVLLFLVSSFSVAAATLYRPYKYYNRYPGRIAHGYNYYPTYHHPYNYNVYYHAPVSAPISYYYGSYPRYYPSNPYGSYYSNAKYSSYYASGRFTGSKYSGNVWYAGRRVN